MTLGTRLRQAREDADLRQTDVMQRTNISNKTLSNWENDRSQPDAEQLVMLAKLYNVTTDELLGADRGYYADAEAVRLAQQLKDFPYGRALLDATRGCSPESIKEIERRFQRLMRCVLYNLPCDVRGFVMEDNETLEPVCVLNARLTHEANQKTFLHEAEHIKEKDFDRMESADEIEEKRHKKRPCINDARQGE